MSVAFGQFELRQSDDDVKTDLEITCNVCETVLCDASAGDTVELLVSVTTDHRCGDWERATCRYCQRLILNSPTEGWVCPEATGDDRIWRESCENHDTFTAEHEPEEDGADDTQEQTTTPPEVYATDDEPGDLLGGAQR